MILILTNERDITTDYVVIELHRRGVPFCRLNSERIAEANVSFNPKGGEGSWVVNTGKKIIEFSSIKSAYFRRPGNPKINSCVTDEAASRYCEVEWGAALTFALNSLGDRWLNSPLAILVAENKPRQLSVAYEIGFLIPDTLITNDFRKVQDFLKDGPLVAKPLRHALIESDDTERVIFTTRIENVSDADELSITTAPVIYQKEIQKQADIRVTVVGDVVYAVKILSQDHDETKTDWRCGSRIDLPHHIHKLPSPIEEKCVSLVCKLGLRFGAIDLILDQKGKYWFLEINPNGQWAWIENRTDLPITHTIVNELEKIAACY